MTSTVITAEAGLPIHQAARRLADRRISGAPVLDDGRVVGMITEADLINAVMPPARRRRGVSVLDVLSVITTMRPRPRQRGLKVSDVMSSIVITVKPDASIWTAADLLQSHGIKRLPVITEEEQLVGLVSRADIVRAVARDDQTIRREILEAVSVIGPDLFEDLNVKVEEGVASLTGNADRRSTHELAVRITARVPGVLEVVDRLEHDLDDTKLKVAVRGYGDPRHNWRGEKEIV